MDHSDPTVKLRNPKEKAGILSALTFFFTFDVFKKAYKNVLQEEDIYQNIYNFNSSRLGKIIEIAWQKEQIDNYKPKFYKALLKCYGKQYILFGFIQLFVRTSMIFIQPHVLGKLIAYFAPNQTQLTLNDAYFYGTSVIVLNIFNCLYNHNYMQILTEFIVKVRVAIGSLIYRKALRLKAESLADITVGKIVTLITKDIFTFDSSLIFLNDMWIGLVQTAIICYLIYNKIGVSAFVGIGCFTLIIPIQVYLGKKVTSIRLESAKKTDERIKVTQETLSAIKIIKMYTWEPFFTKQINNSRNAELNKLKCIYYLKALNMCIGALSSKLCFYILVIFYIYTGNNLTAEVGFYIISCLGTLRSYITISIPLGISQGAELLAALKRIEIYLQETEIKEADKIAYTTEPIVHLKHVAVKLKDKEILKDVSLEITKGLLIVTGPVGSGKSSLLKTIVKEYNISQGTREVLGTVSYAPDEPWLFPSTIQQNILFGLPYDQNRYNTILNICALSHDLKQFEKGDLTIVNDRGVNLSKGQQARITLARAIYRESDIYLIDDILVSLDANINKFVFRECIRNFLKDKICILVTSNLNHLQLCHNIVVLDQGKSLSLEEQKNCLDKRITCYVDETFDDSDSETELEIDGEMEKLIKPSATNIYKETNVVGKVKAKIYWEYCKFFGGILSVLFLIVLFAGGQTVISYSDTLVSKWIDLEQNITTFKVKNNTNSSEYEKLQIRDHNTMTVYSVMLIVATIVTVIRALTTFNLLSKGSKKIHNKMAESVFNSSLEFFDKNQIGVILNRFSKDMSTVDEFLPFIIFENFRILSLVTGVLSLLIYVNKFLAIPVIVIFTALYFVRMFYIPAGRSLKRLEASTRSPMIGYLNSTLEGLTTIRTYNKQEILIREFDRHQDHFTSTNFMMVCATRAFGFILDILCSVLIGSVIVYFLLVRGESAGNVGLAVTQAMSLTGILQWLIRQWAELENQMTSVERILQFSHNKSEGGGTAIENWPTNGKIVYKNINLTYEISKQNALKNVNFTIEPKQKIGIVGRTGAGKSSIIATLFRLYKFDGHIKIDNKDINKISLNCLRSHIAIIPQDPILFSGSIRTNIDPLCKYSDQEIWSTIEKVNLKDHIPALTYIIPENGRNFSSGQKQLICLARALVSDNKIIVLDEATSNMDLATDDIMQQMIKEHFKNRTVLTIVHRLNHISNYEKVMVVDNGEVVQFDTPENLENDENGLFYKMVNNYAGRY